MDDDEDVDDEDWTKPVYNFGARLDPEFPPTTRTRRTFGSPTASSSSASGSNTMDEFYTNAGNTTGLSSFKASLTGPEDAEDDHSRTIVHIDLDCFYAQVEMVRNPALRGKPLGVQQKYLLVTCNYVARARGVTKLMRVLEAVQRCPDLVIVSGEDLTHYREMSYRITELLHQFSPLVERLGFDENFVDVTQLVYRRSQEGGLEAAAVGHVYGESSECTDTGAAVAPLRGCGCGCQRRLAAGSHIAKEMREALRVHLGLTSCAGVAHNKLLAKLVGSAHKPDDQTTLLPSQAGKLLATLTKVTQVPGIGHSTGKKLALLGITTLNELTAAPLTLLKDEFGYQTAYTMQRLCQGHDDSPVVRSGPPQSISDEDSFRKCGTLAEAKLKIKALLTSLLQRLRKDGRQPVTLRLSVRNYSKVQKWTRESRQCGLPSGILHSLQLDEDAATSKLLDLCLCLFKKMVDTSRPFHLTMISVCFAKLQSPAASSASTISRFFRQISTPECTDDATCGDANNTAAGSPSGPQSDDLRSEAVAAGAASAGKTQSPVTDAISDTSLSLNSAVEETPRCVSRHRPATSSEDRPLLTEGTDAPAVGQSGARPERPGKSGLEADVWPRKQLFSFAQRSQAGAAPRTSPGEGDRMGARERKDQGPAASAEADGEQPASVGGNSPEATTSKHEAALALVPPDIDRAVFAELPAEVQQELLAEWKSSHSTAKPENRKNPADSGGSLTNQLPGIDSAVFKELPPDIQDDVLRQYKHKRTSTEVSPNKSSQNKRPRTGKSPAKKTTDRSGSRSITDYFGTECKK